LCEVTLSTCFNFLCPFHTVDLSCLPTGFLMYLIYCADDHIILCGRICYALLTHYCRSVEVLPLNDVRVADVLTGILLRVEWLGLIVSCFLAVVIE